MTGRELLEWLKTLPDNQLDLHLSVSSGCDDNGNAEFFHVGGVCVVGDGIVDAAADDVLDTGSPVILFDE